MQSIFLENIHLIVQEREGVFAVVYHSYAENKLALSPLEEEF